MQVSSRVGEQVEVSRQELYEDYVRCYLELCPEGQPCRDGRLLEKVAQYLLREPRPEGMFTVFPFYQAVADDQEADNSDCRKHLSAFIKATELLETLCVNLFLQPWKKEFKTLKAFTGPFVYCLLPVLRRSTIQTVLASIGYLSHMDPRSKTCSGTTRQSEVSLLPDYAAEQDSEFRLSGDVNPDRAILLGFELLLARMECYHLLKLVEKDNLGPQEWLELLQRRGGAMKVEKSTEKKMIAIYTEKETKEEKDRKEVPLYSDARLAVSSEPKPRRCYLISTDQSIMEMQRTYPDLAFRGHPLVPDKPHQAKRIRGSSKAAHIASPNNNDNIKVFEPQNRNRNDIKGNKAFPTTVCSRNDESKMDEMLADDSRGGGCHASIGFRKEGHSRDYDESVECPATAESSADDTDTHQHTLHIGRLSRPELSSLSSTDKEQHLRKLAERMAQLQFHPTKEEFKGKGENES